MADGTGQNGTVDVLSAKQKRAAIMLAEATMTQESIARDIGVSRSTLNRWRELPEFQDAIKRVDAELLAEAMRLPLARKHHRMSVLNSLHTKALTVIDERAAEMAHDAPGIGTGLVVHQIKQVGSGRSAVMVDEYAVDTPLMREIRAIQEQAAKEAGQWVEKSEEVGNGVRREYVVIREPSTAQATA